MGVGGLVFAGAALLGLIVVLASVPWLYLAIKVIGACYLLYLALRLWKGANDPLERRTCVEATYAEYFDLSVSAWLRS